MSWYQREKDSCIPEKLTAGERSSNMNVNPRLSRSVITFKEQPWNSNEKNWLVGASYAVQTHHHDSSHSNNWKSKDDHFWDFSL
jgi:hypothetical protein